MAGGDVAHTVVAADAIDVADQERPDVVGQVVGERPGGTGREEQVVAPITIDVANTVLPVRVDPEGVGTELHVRVAVGATASDRDVCGNMLSRT
jgi:hypothetical protein